ncbi:hypothetical protein [Caldiplasma sukawensis]
MEESVYDKYLKRILHSDPKALLIVLDEIENDPFLTDAEINILEEEIQNVLKFRSNVSVKVVNKYTGREEMPPKTYVNNFDGSVVYEGEKIMYGIIWRVYTPTIRYADSKYKIWYYNEKISKILSDVLLEEVPGRLPDYFDYPPWLFGRDNFLRIQYVPLQDIVFNAIINGTIKGWETLIEKGIPREMVDDLRSKNLGNYN